MTDIIVSSYIVAVYRINYCNTGRIQRRHYGTVTIRATIDYSLTKPILLLSTNLPGINGMPVADAKNELIVCCAELWPGGAAAAAAMFTAVCSIHGLSTEPVQTCDRPPPWILSKA